MLNFKFNGFVILVISYQIESSLRPVEVDKDVSIISDVLVDIVDEYFIKENIHFQVHVFKEYNWYTIEILNAFMSKSNGSFKQRIHFHKHLEYNKKSTFLHQSKIFFLKSIDDIISLEHFYQAFRYLNQPVNYFIFIPGLTFNQLKRSGLLNSFKYLYVFADFMFQYEYFIINEPERVILATVEWFSAEKCGEAHWKVLNYFQKKSRKWSTKLVNYEKFIQYYGCKLTLISPVHNKIVYDTSNYAEYEFDNKVFKFKGIVPIIFEITAKLHNFSSVYLPAIMPAYIFEDPRAIEQIELFTNDRQIVPNVYFSARSLIGGNPLIRRSNAFMSLNYLIAVTPAEAYTPYEKFLLPFDYETWIFLIITFLVTFLSIFFINFLSKSTQDIVYGHRVDTPFWNVISISFGISQTRLPNKNFSRFILILFVFFCLIFRTCFQSKFFEFMTSEPRRPPPKTIEDLIEKKYTMYLSEEHRNDIKFFDERLRIQYISILKFYEIFNTQSQNSSAKAALYVDELTQNHIESINKSNHNWIEFQDAYMVSHDTFAFPQFAFYFGMFRKVTNRLIDTGVIKYLSDNYYTKKIIYKKPKPDPKVLNLDNMMFGFNIWLGCCCVSIIAFVIEIVKHRLVKKYFDKVSLKDLVPKLFKRFGLVSKILNEEIDLQQSNVSDENEYQRKLKFAKVHPIETGSTQNCKLKRETLKMFKIRALRSLNTQYNYWNKLEIIAEVHN